MKTFLPDPPFYGHLQPLNPFSWESRARSSTTRPPAQMRRGINRLMSPKGCNGQAMQRLFEYAQMLAEFSSAACLS